MAMQEFLASFAVEIDESGVNRLQGILKENRGLAEALAEAFAGAKAAMEAGFGEMPEGLNLTVSLDQSKATQTLRAFQRSEVTKISLSGDASSVVAAANSALASIKASYAGTTLTISAKVNTENASGAAGNSGVNGSSSGSGMFRASAGGRFTRATTTEVAEDGQTEYVIPVQKEGIAVPLVRQLLGELSASAKEAVAPALGSLPGMMRAGTTVSASVPAASSSIQAPVNITVNAGNAQPEAVGRSVYRLAERYLIRTLKGVTG